MTTMMMQWHVTRDVVYEAVVRDGALPKVNGLNNVALSRISAMVSVGPDESMYISPFLRLACVPWSKRRFLSMEIGDACALIHKMGTTFRRIELLNARLVVP